MNVRLTAASVAKALCHSVVITILALFISDKGGACGISYHEPSQVDSAWLYVGVFALSLMLTALLGLLKSIRGMRCAT